MTIDETAVTGARYETCLSVARIFCGFRRQSMYSLVNLCCETRYLLRVVQRQEAMCTKIFILCYIILPFTALGAGSETQRPQCHLKDLPCIFILTFHCTFKATGCNPVDSFPHLGKMREYPRLAESIQENTTHFFQIVSPKS